MILRMWKAQSSPKQLPTPKLSPFPGLCSHALQLTPIVFRFPNGTAIPV